jgi:oligopeptide transport system substrate-binding protein
MLVQKRLIGILGTVAIIATACGTSTASTAPTAAPSTAASAAASAAASTAPSEAPSASAGAELADDQTLRVTLGAEDPATLDPSKASTSTDIGVLHALNRGLVYFDKDLNPVPSLATELPTISADGMTYTFTLRDAKYSNGDPIVADDLVFAWKRELDPRTAASYQAFLGDVVGADKLIAMTGAKPAPTDADIEAALGQVGVSAPDPKTFVIKLTHPTAYFLDIVALWVAGPIQEKWVNTPNFTEAANYVSSGPFMMKSWTHQSEIVLVPNPNWYGTKPTLTTLHYAIGGDPTANQASFEAGELDMLAANPPDVPRIKADATLGPLVKTQPVLVFDYWGFDTSSETTYKGEPHKPGPTANVHFRRALSMAIDKDTMMATVYGGQGVVAGSPIPPGMPGHQADIGLKYDVAAAKVELAQALTELGYKDVSEVPTLSFGFNTNAGHEITSAYMQEQWSKNLGIKSELKGVTFDTFVVERPKLVYSIARNAWGADYPHPDNFLRALFGSKSGNNDEGYNNPAYDDLIAKAGAEPDQAKSIALYNQAQELLVQDAPAVFTRWRVSNYEVEPWVQGVTGTGQDSVVIGDLFYENISIAKH